VSTSLDGTMRFWNMETGDETGHIAGHTGPVATASISHDGQLLASSGGYNDYQTRLWRMADGQYLKTLKLYSYGYGSGPSFSPTSLVLAFGDGYSGVIQILS